MSASSPSGVLPIVAAALFTLAGGFVGKLYVDRELARRPPVVLIDEGALIKARGGVQIAPAELQKIYTDVDQAARSLQDAGYVVLRGNAVYAVPSGVEVTP